MSSLTILQLSQTESDDVTQNGVFTTVLDTPVLLEEGDVVQVKSVYLDTVIAGAGTIPITAPINATLSVAKYIQNYSLDQDYTYAVGGAAPLRIYEKDAPTNTRTVDNQGDNQLWWLSEVASSDEEYFEISGFNLLLKDYKTTVRGFGRCELLFRYTPITPGAVPTTFSYHINYNSNNKIDKLNPLDLNIQAKSLGGSPMFELISDPEYMLSHNITGVDFVPFSTLISPGTAEQRFQLQTEDFNFTIPIGNYTPAEMISFINDELTGIEHSGKVQEFYSAGSAATPITQTEWPVSSPFLTTCLQNTQQLHSRSADLTGCFVNASSGQIQPDGTDISGTKYMVYDIAKMKGEFRAAVQAAPPDGPITQYRPPLDRYFGANEISFGYDAGENKLTIQQAHMPIYVNDSGTAADIVNDAVPGAIFSGALTGLGFVANSGISTRYSGLAFTAMTPTEFWTNQMGFTNVCVNPQYTAKCPYPDPSDVPTNNNSFTMTTADGINLTGAYAGLDLAVQHNSHLFQRPQFADVNTAEVKGDPNGTISTANTTSIFSNRIWNNNLADEGFFLLDVATNFSQNLIGKLTTTNNTQSIVNRFYTANSFTSDQGAGSIVYEHVGAPQMLSSFDVRVRNPDRSFCDAHTLTNKNTVFIEIQKAAKSKTNPK